MTKSKERLHCKLCLNNKIIEQMMTVNHLGLSHPATVTCPKRCAYKLKKLVRISGGVRDKRKAHIHRSTTSINLRDRNKSRHPKNKKPGDNQIDENGECKC